MTSETAGARPKLPILDEEVPFAFEELFFSRTDWRGVIQAGNSVFQRVSIYDWDELLGKPHNVIRHPDMPKGVFWLFWDAIKRGEPIGAYVKNRAKDGRYYWVYAIVTPIEGGYLSVRLKPDSPLFATVAQEYKSLLATVPDTKAGAAAGAEVLLRRLAELGFETYPAFMAAALAEEVAARNRRVGREPDAAIACFGVLVAAARALLAQAEMIFDAYAQSEHVPLNLRIHSAHLGEAGAAIGAISNNYDLISTEIRDSMRTFVAAAAGVLATTNDGLFLLCTASIQRDVAESFREEIAAAGAQAQGAGQGEEMRLLEDQQEVYQQKAVEGLRTINDRVGQFRQDCADMKRLASSLETTRVMGKMECARLAGVKDGLNELIDDLEAFQAAIVAGLKEIDANNQNIQHNVRRLVQIIGARAPGGGHAARSFSLP